MKKIFIFLSSVFLLFIIFIASTYLIRFIKSKNIRDCKRSGGIWVETGPVLSNGQPQMRFCDFPPADEGKMCYEDSECIIDCISTSESDEEGYILGKCGEYSALECTPTIPKKTKSRNELKRGLCT